jgi:hypothetical protein
VVVVVVMVVVVMVMVVAMEVVTDDCHLPRDNHFCNCFLCTL